MVAKEHIKKSLARRLLRGYAAYKHCPLAMAASEHFDHNVSVGVSAVYTNNGVYSHAAEEFTKAFDRQQPVEPREVVLWKI